MHYIGVDGGVHTLIYTKAPPGPFEADFRPRPGSFSSFFRFSSFSPLVTKWDFEDFPDSGGRPFVFRFSFIFVFIRFRHLTPFGRPARAGCLGRAERAGGGILPSIYT